VNCTPSKSPVARFAEPRNLTNQDLNERTQEVIENIHSSSKKRAELPQYALNPPRLAIVKCALACAFRQSDAQSVSRKTPSAEQTYKRLNILPSSHLRAKNRSLPAEPASAILQRAVLN
jgi:hypothetical protein